MPKPDDNRKVRRPICFEKLWNYGKYKVRLQNNQRQLNIVDLIDRLKYLQSAQNRHDET